MWQLTRSPKERQHEITDYLIENLKGDLIRAICNLLYNLDPCFDVLAGFNEIDIGEIKQTSFYYPNRKSFLFWSVLLEGHPITTERIRDTDPRLNPYELCYEFLDSLVLVRSEESNDKLESFLFEVTEEAYFLAFHIKTFRNLAAKWSNTPHKKKK